MTQHTPTPWETEDDTTRIWRRGDCENEIVFVRGYDNAHPDVQQEKSLDENLANAAHIVKCVNAYDDLVAALTELSAAEAHYRQTHDFYGGNNVLTGQAWRRIKLAGDAARAILDKVKS